MNKDLKNLLQLIIKAGVEQGILGRSSRICRKSKVRVSPETVTEAQDVKNGKEE